MSAPSLKDRETKRLEFSLAVQAEGMPVIVARYCMVAALRLRIAYASVQADKLPDAEEEAIAGLRVVLEQSAFSYVLGGLHEGDTTELYIVPARENPIPVPVAEEDDMEVRLMSPRRGWETSMDRDSIAREIWYSQYAQYAQQQRDIDAILYGECDGRRYMVYTPDEDAKEPGWKGIQQTNEAKKRKAKRR